MEDGEIRAGRAGAEGRAGGGGRNSRSPCMGKARNIRRNSILNGKLLKLLSEKCLKQ